MLRALSHTPESGWVELDDPTRISDVLQQPGAILWAFADVADLKRDTIRMIAEEFALHPLAVDDALHLGQRPKLEPYENHLFAVTHQLDTEDGQLEARQIANFVGRNFVLTLHERSQRTIDETLERAKRSPRNLAQGPSFVMHALLDTVVDEYQRIADDLEERIEDIEDTVLRAPATPFQRELYSLKQQLARLRRYVVPGERVLATVLEPNRFPLITERTGAHFRDVHDHAQRVIGQIQNIQALVDAVAELQRSEQANALNDVTKRLTGWAAIIAVPTFIASVYGMNFSLIPTTGGRAGFWAALGLMAATGAALFAFFKRRRWI